MQLLLAIVQNEDADVLSRRLNEAGLRATRINSAGGFLARGNATFMLGLEEQQIDQAINIIRANCRTRRSFVNALPWGPEVGHVAAASAMPLEVQVGGAVIFTLPVKRFVRLRGGDMPPATDEAWDRPADDSSDLVIAIIQNEDAATVVPGLTQAGYRLTQLNTAGAFLRRGNVTLLVAVEHDRLDPLISLIQANCKPRTAANQITAGMPAYAAAIFVVPAQTILQLS